MTSLSWCNGHGVNSTHHCHYTMASGDSKFDDFFLQCNFNNENVNSLIAVQLSGFTCTRSLTINSKFLIPHETLPSSVLKKFSFIVSVLVHC